MASKILAAALAASTLLLGACGGGGDSQPAATNDAVATVDAFAYCNVATAAAGAPAVHVAVAQDAYSYPDTFGVQDRTSSVARFRNDGASAVTVQVALSSQRTLMTPTGLSGTTPLVLALAATDETVDELINDPGLAALKASDPVPAGCQPAIAAAAAGATMNATELHRMNVRVPAGHTVTFWSIARVAPEVGSAGNVRLNTTALDLSVTPL